DVVVLKRLLQHRTIPMWLRHMGWHDRCCKNVGKVASDEDIGHRKRENALNAHVKDRNVKRGVARQLHRLPKSTVAGDDLMTKLDYRVFEQDAENGFFFDHQDAKFHRVLMTIDPALVAQLVVSLTLPRYGRTGPTLLFHQQQGLAAFGDA